MTRPLAILFVLFAVIAAFAPARAVVARQRTAEPQTISVSAAVRPTSAFVGEQVRWQILVDGSRNVNRPDVPPVPNAEIEFLGGQDRSQQSTVIINGVRRDERYEGFAFTFGVTPTTPGQLELPALTLFVNGKAYNTEPVRIEVLAPREEREARLIIAVSNTSPYVGEPVELGVTFATQRDFQRLQFAFPGVGSGAEARFTPSAFPSDYAQGNQWVALELFGEDTPAVQGRAKIDGADYYTFTMKKMLIPRAAGKQSLGPATAATNLVLVRGTVFDAGQIRRISIPSNAVELNVRELPTDGRPPNFNGLVGRYTIAAGASPSEVSVGDPISLSITISGPLADAVRAPAIEKQPDIAAAFRVAEDDRPPTTAPGQKTFTRTLRAISTDATSIPPIELPYFNTKSGKYEVARSAPIPLTVRAAKLVTAADAEGVRGVTTTPNGSEIESTTTGIAANYERLDALVPQRFDLLATMRSPMGITTLAAPPLAYIASAVVCFMRKRAANDPLARRRRAAKSAALQLLNETDATHTTTAADAVARAVVGYLSDKSGAPAASITPPEAERLIAPRDPALAARARSLMERCDSARFGGLEPAAARDLLAEARELITALESKFGGTP